MPSIQELLNQRITQLENPKEGMIEKRKNYNKEYANAVKCFQDRINKDRKKEKKEPVTFMAVRMKLAGVRELDDLRVWYKTCLEYSYTRDKKILKRKTFSQCFWGGLSTKNK